jgi:hypothetical protein
MYQLRQFGFVTGAASLSKADAFSSRACMSLGSRVTRIDVSSADHWKSPLSKRIDGWGCGAFGGEQRKRD